MNEKTCTSCRFYKEEHVHHQVPGSRFPDPPSSGRCRRYPPLPFDRGGSGMPVAYAFPVVTPADWCGEFSPR